MVWVKFNRINKTVRNSKGAENPTATIGNVGFVSSFISLALIRSRSRLDMICLFVDMDKLHEMR